jgi:hypothetical protein
MRPIRWLHISDIHMRPREVWSQDVVLRAMLEDLEQRRRNHPLDFILLSGDAFSGKVEEYALVSPFVDALTAASGVPRERIFCIPGNHDIDRWIAYHLWSATRPPGDSSRRRALSELRAEDAEADRRGFWAAEAVNTLVRELPEQAWLMILRLVELSPDDRTLASVAAGALEDLLGSHPCEFIGRVEHQSRTDAKLRRCLSASIPEDVQVRMRRTWEGEDPYRN